MGNLGLAHGEGKHSFPTFSSVFAFKQAKEQIMFLMQPLKMVIQKICSF